MESHLRSRLTVAGKVPSLRWLQHAVALSLVAPASAQGVDTSAPAISARESRQGCTNDPQNLGKAPFVGLTIHALGLSRSRFQFIGCPQALFKATNGFADSMGIRTFTIYYRTTVRSEHLGPEDYVAPVVHELAHAYQIALAGGLGPLQQSYCSERRELGADFLTGYLFRNHLTNVDKSNFQHNLNLLGGYIETSHGEPPDRSQAFRSGYEAAQFLGLTSISDAYEYFQAIRFMEIASRYPSIQDRCP